LPEQDGDWPRRCQDHRDHDDDVDDSGDHDDRADPDGSEVHLLAGHAGRVPGRSTSVGGTDADGPHTIVSYTWDFGDGDPPKTGVTATHDFVKTGIYLVTLTVVNDKGTKASRPESITVRPTSTTPKPCS
jgi:hypothetical protein